MLGSNEYGRTTIESLRVRPTAGRLAWDAAAGRIVDLVGAARGVTRAEILSHQRCTRRVVAARQLAMYLVHTLLGRNYLEVGQLFGRDRTTVSYACARIEDRREDRSAFEREVAAIETAVASAGEVRRAAR
jgi:chromosomal replication initiation ATPase DnaA